MVGKINEKAKRYFSNGPKAIFLTLLVLMGMTIIICNTRKNFIVTIDGKPTKITTFKKTYGEALKAQGIEVGSKDKTSPGLDSEIKSGSNVLVKKAVNVEVQVDNKALAVQTAEDSIEKMLEAEGIGVQEYDKVSPSLDTPLSEGMKVAVVRVEAKVLKDNQPIDFTTVVKKDDDMEEGATKVVQEGTPGEKEIATRVIYENGKEVSRKVVSETVKSQPVQKVVAMGTLGVLTPSRGSKILFKNSLSLRATAYSGGGHTASGTHVRRSSNGYSSVAVDPRVIPLGTRLYIEGYGYAIAEDTGGAIKGNRIDLYFDTEGECNSFGVRNVKVYILK